MSPAFIIASDAIIAQGAGWQDVVVEQWNCILPFERDLLAILASGAVGPVEGTTATFSGDVTLGGNVILGTTTGTKFGTTTSQKLAFYGSTPIVQRSAVAGPSGGVTVDTEARDAIIGVLQALQAYGLLAP